jgi:hypothetical protein
MVIKGKGFLGTSAKYFIKIINDNGLKSPSGHHDFNTYIKGNATDFKKKCI